MWWFLQHKSIIDIIISYENENVGFLQLGANLQKLNTSHSCSNPSSFGGRSDPGGVSGADSSLVELLAAELVLES